MGMFDEVNYSAPCRKCGAIIKKFQSKDGPCQLEMLEPLEVQQFYECCAWCETWNEFKVTRVIERNTEAEARSDAQSQHTHERYGPPKCAVCQRTIEACMSAPCEYRRKVRERLGLPL